jgi:hypothetical protein
MPLNVSTIIYSSSGDAQMRHLEYCVRVLSVDCARVKVELT